MDYTEQEQRNKKVEVIAKRISNFTAKLILDALNNSFNLEAESEDRTNLIFFLDSIRVVLADVDEKVKEELSRIIE